MVTHADKQETFEQVVKELQQFDDSDEAKAMDKLLEAEITGGM